MKPLEKAREAQKPKLIEECFDYKIEKIPLNYRATIKCAIHPKHAFRGLDRDHYVDDDNTVENLKRFVEDEIKSYYISGKLPEQPEGLKNAQATV